MALDGVSGTGAVGTVTAFAGALIPITGVSAGTAVGSVALIKLLVPDIHGINTAAATLLLNASSFQLGTQSFTSSLTVPVGSIISQNPLASTLQFENTPIAVLVSSGPPSPSNIPIGDIRLPNLPNQILPPNNALVDDRGVIASNWWRFLLNVSNQAMGVNQTPPGTVTPTASPFIFTTPAQGTLLVSGGPVTLIEYSKDGTTWYPMGVTNGPLHLVPNDRVRITYSNAPAVTFFPQ